MHDARSPESVRDAMIRESRAAGPDPFPDDVDGPVSSSRSWYYPWGQLELARLHELVRRGFEANRHVDYVDNFGDVVAEAEFRWSTRSGPRHVRVVTPPGVPPSVAPGGPAAPTGTVEVRLPQGAWQPAARHEGSSACPPHRSAETTVPVAGRWRDGVLELPAPVLGRPVVTSRTRPSVVTGESRAEALAKDDASHETRHELVRRPDGRWASRHLLGFRYLTVSGTDGGADDDVTVEVEAQVRPMPRRGAFLCSDDRLNRIWATSAYTLRLCLQDLVVDGIKRDRMPWMGDQALSTLTNAYAFADRRAVHDTLVALGQPRHGYVNGIADYSLWWVIACGFYLRHFDAAADVGPLADRVEDLLTDMSDHADADGVLRPAALPDQFVRHVFLDWGLEIDADRDLTALQVLWWWAMTAGARILAAADRPGALRWERLAGRLRGALVGRAWDPAAGSWREHLDDDGPSRTPYADFLSVVAGLSEPVDSLRATMRDADRVGTPFMTAFALMALGRAGDRTEAVRRLRTWWGEMLDAGALTFWEDFGGSGDDGLAMYGRPFGKSLCHGWSAGPLVLLPELVLGVRPLADGWAVLEVDPHLGDLAWARAVVPVPGGDVVVDAVTTDDGVTVVVEVPPGSTLRDHERGDLGPGRWTLTYPKENAE